MMSAKQTTKVISDILNNAPDGVAVLYSGTTGIGKTYDWFHFISPALKADKKYYVSLSGISDTAGIRNALLGDYFRQNTHPVARALLFMLFLIISSAIILPYQEKIFNLTTSETYNFIGYPDMARICFEDAIKLYGLNFKYYLNLTQCYKQLGITQTKIKEFQNTKNPYEKIQLGLLYIQSGEVRKGVITLDELCNEEPDLLITPAIRQYLKTVTETKL